MSTVTAALVTPAEKTAADRQDEAVRTILFYDGACGLCNKSVAFVLARDRKARIQFAPLQGDTARQLLPPADQQDLNSMVLWVAGRRYRRSAAAVRILWRLGLGWQIVGSLLWMIPLPLRDLGYVVIARNRYRFFGTSDACRLPSESERLRFLP